MRLNQLVFLSIASAIRGLPQIRGKVRLGLFSYRILRLKAHDFVIETTMFSSRLRFQLNLNCAHERMGYLMGHYEDETSSLLAELYSEGSILDVGANIGFISLPLAMKLGCRMHGEGRNIYAVEPLPSNYEALRKNIGLNGLSAAVKPLNIGLGAVERELFIQIEGDNPSRTGTGNILPASLNFKKIPITVKTVDHMISEKSLPANLTLIKIDTDGYDFEVLKGAQRLLETNRPLILAELDDHAMRRHGYGIEDVATELQQVDYGIWMRRTAKTIRFTRYSDPGNYTRDCLLIPYERTSALAGYLD